MGGGRGLATRGGREGWVFAGAEFMRILILAANYLGNIAPLKNLSPSL